MALGRSMEREGKLAEQNAALRARVAELERKLDDEILVTGQLIGARDSLVDALAASRARERRLREFAEHVKTLGKECICRYTLTVESGAGQCLYCRAVSALAAAPPAGEGVGP